MTRFIESIQTIGGVEITVSFDIGTVEVSAFGIGVSVELLRTREFLKAGRGAEGLLWEKGEPVKHIVRRVLPA